LITSRVSIKKREYFREIKRKKKGFRRTTEGLEKRAEEHGWEVKVFVRKGEETVLIQDCRRKKKGA